MARINLLPHRQERRKEQQSVFFAMCGLVMFAAMITVMLWNQIVVDRFDLQRQRNQLIDQQTALLDKDIKTIDDLQKKKDDLLKRMEVIQELQGTRPVIVRIFDEMVRIMPNGVYMTDFERHGNEFHINGVANTNNDVSTLMRNIQASAWFKDANLQNVQALPAAAGSSPSDGATSHKNAFSMNFALQLPDSLKAGSEGKKGKTNAEAKLGGGA